MNPAVAEVEILQSLDRAVQRPRASRVLAELADEVTALLTKNSRAQLAWRPVGLGIYDGLPEGIASSWVFVLRAGCSSGAERHPNSIQRVKSHRGSADLRTWSGDRWVSHKLHSERQSPIERRWLSIPINTWHRPIMGNQNWVVVSFHTVPDDKLIEERPADSEHPDQGPVVAQLYAGREAR